MVKINEAKKTYQQFVTEFLNEQDVMMMVAVMSRAIQQDHKQVERLAKAMEGDSEGLHETFNVMEIETIVNMYCVGFNIGSISAIMGHDDNFYVGLQLYLCDRITLKDAEACCLNQLQRDDVKNSRKEQEKEFITKDQMTTELMEYMSTRVREEDTAIVDATGEQQKQHLITCVGNYIDDYITTVRIEDAEEIAVEVLLRYTL